MEVRKILSTARTEYVKWITNPRMIILGVMLIFINDFAVSPLLKNAEDMNSPLNILEPFIAVANSQLLILIIPAVYLTLISDFPRTDGNTLFFLLRTGKLNWLLGQVLFVIMTIFTFVGVVFAGMQAGNEKMTVAGAFALAIGIALQNFPEGVIISAPLLNSGVSKRRAFSYGVLSGAVEPVGAILTILLTSLVVPILPYILAFAAGAMIYVVVEELIPESQSGEHSNIGTIGVAAGFVLMMILDVTLG